jgi:putative hydrolase of the HAD superfamily
MQFDLIALDADDTLWHNEIYYRRSRKTFNTVLGKYGLPDPDHMRLHEIELANLEFYGYGAVGFSVSMVEAAIEMTGGQIDASDLLQLINTSKDIISAKVELFEGAEQTVRSLARSHSLMLLTKGDQHHQASKIERSGLKPYFDHVEIVAEKSPEIYGSLLKKLNVPAERFLMVGNAMRSDILPVLEIGGHAVYIHNDLTWTHENADRSNLPQERFFELETIGALPALVQEIEG